MNLLKKLTQNLDKEKLTNAILILFIITLSVIYKLNKLSQ